MIGDATTEELPVEDDTELPRACALNNVGSPEKQPGRVPRSAFKLSQSQRACKYPSHLTNELIGLKFLQPGSFYFLPEDLSNGPPSPVRLTSAQAHDLRNSTPRLFDCQHLRPIYVQTKPADNLQSIQGIAH